MNIPIIYKYYYKNWFIYSIFVQISLLKRYTLLFLGVWCMHNLKLVKLIILIISISFALKLAYALETVDQQQTTGGVPYQFYFDHSLHTFAKQSFIPTRETITQVALGIFLDDAGLRCNHYSGEDVRETFSLTIEDRGEEIYAVAQNYRICANNIPTRYAYETYGTLLDIPLTQHRPLVSGQTYWIKVRYNGILRPYQPLLFWDRSPNDAYSRGSSVTNDGSSTADFVFKTYGPEQHHRVENGTDTFLDVKQEQGGQTFSFYYGCLARQCGVNNQDTHRFALQTFKPRTNGYLTRVGLKLKALPNSTWNPCDTLGLISDTFSIEVRDLRGNVLGSKDNIPVCNASHRSFRWHEITLDAPVKISRGNMYQIAVLYTGRALKNNPNFAWERALRDAYSPGVFIYNTNGTLAKERNDGTFRIYVRRG